MACCRVDSEHNGVGFVAISNISVTYHTFSLKQNHSAEFTPRVYSSHDMDWINIKSLGSDGTAQVTRQWQNFMTHIWQFIHEAPNYGKHQRQIMRVFQHEGHMLIHNLRACGIVAKVHDYKVQLTKSYKVGLPQHFTTLKMCFCTKDSARQQRKQRVENNVTLLKIYHRS